MGREGTGQCEIKVTWDKVCLHKQEGGVGLKKVVDLDKAGAMKHIWS